MRWARIAYRLSQFWRMLPGRSAHVDRQEVRRFLGAPLTELFERMHPAEQAHSMRVYGALREQGETDPDLLAAALLHDAGKSRRPLRLFERVLIVLMRAAAPGFVRRWGGGSQPAGGLRGAFQTAEQHPAWGAEMAAGAGASPQTCELIRRHQEKSAAAPGLHGDGLLIKLQAVDDNY